jgi:hypothetical protein
VDLEAENLAEEDLQTAQTGVVRLWSRRVSLYCFWMNTTRGIGLNVDLRTWG